MFGHRGSQFAKEGKMVAGTKRSYCVGVLGIIGFLVVAQIGCGRGEQDPRKFPVWGSVTYKGAPVPAGSITFEPDSSKGNKGPAASFKIRNGKYDSRAEGVGHVGGPHKVRIVGLSGEESADEFFPEGAPLFPEWQTTVDLPKGPSEQNFEVPAEWVTPAVPRQVAPAGP